MAIDERGTEIAGKEEVLATYTQLLRGDKPSEQMKAADALAKYHGLFSPREEVEEISKGSPEIALAIEKAIAEMLGKEDEFSNG